jgi:cardiolipin synthase
MTEVSSPAAPESQPALNGRNQWRFATIPNMLSLLRLAMLGPTVWALITRRNLLAFILFVASSLTDALDGWIARHFHQESEWGKILDPIADKLTLNTLAMILAFQGRIPLFLALIVLGRDVAILAGSLLLLTSKTFVPQSNWAGKITGLAFFAMLCAGLLNARWLLDDFLVPLVTVLVFLTLVTNTYTSWQAFNKRQRENANTGTR